MSVRIGSIGHSELFLIVDALHSIGMADMVKPFTVEQEAKAIRLAAKLLEKA